MGTATLHTTINNKRSKKNDRKQIVFIGNKPQMSHALAIIMRFSASNGKEITLKARGQSIATAVYVAEISKVSIGTTEMPREKAKTDQEWFQQWK